MELDRNRSCPSPRLCRSAAPYSVLFRCNPRREGSPIRHPGDAPLRLIAPARGTLYQEPITRSEQLNYFRATAFSQVRLFLDTPFPPKISVSGYLSIEIRVNKTWLPNAVVFALVFRDGLLSIYSMGTFPHAALDTF